MHIIFVDKTKLTTHQITAWYIILISFLNTFVLDDVMIKYLLRMSDAKKIRTRKESSN